MLAHAARYGADGSDSTDLSTDLSTVDGGLEPPTPLDQALVDLSVRRIAELEAELVQWREAAETRRRIGVVTGVVAERFAMSPDAAWAFLVRVSQNTNTKVRDVVRVFYDQQWGELSPEDSALALRLSAQLPLAVTRSPALCGTAGPGA